MNKDANTSTKSNEMLVGLVKWFDSDKGFGVIGTPEGEDYFLHIKNFTSNKDVDKILKSTPIVFSPKTDKIKNKKSAEKGRLVGNYEDLKIVLSYLDKHDGVIIEADVTEVEKKGNTYHRKKIQLFSLIGQTLKYIFLDKNEEEVSNFILNYFDKDLTSKHFVAFCELIENWVLEYYSSEKACNILNNVFTHFGKNLNEEILFTVWKEKRFKFISYNEMDDYEIPEALLKANILELGKIELNRIIKYSFGSEFGSFYLKDKFSNLDAFSSEELNEIYQLLEFEIETEQEKRKYELDELYSQRIESEIIEKSKQLEAIRNNNDFKNYHFLFHLIPYQLADCYKDKIISTIHKIISEKSYDEFKVELWLKGIIYDAPFELVSKCFLDNSTHTEKRIEILTKLQTEKQFELLKKYSKEFTFEMGFVLLEVLVKKENSLSYYFKLFEVLFDSEFWKDKKSNELVELFTNYVNDQSNDEQKYELFLKGYVKNVPKNIVQKNIHHLEQRDCKKIFTSVSDNKTFINDILIKKVTTKSIDSLSWIYDLALEFLDQEYFISFEKCVFETIEQAEYFNLWKVGKAKIFPKKHIGEILKDNFENYSQIKTWVENNVTTMEEVKYFLFSYLNNQVPVTDRIIFYKQLNHIKYLLQLNELHLEQIKLIQNDFYNVILWALDKENVLNFELLKRKFIYFKPDAQVRIIKKLFFLKAIGQFDLTIEKLNELTRFDLDLFKTNLKLNPEIPIDISTDVVIKTLVSYQQKKRFFVESELLTEILNDLQLDKTRRFELSNYFEECLGRQTTEFNWRRSGNISKVKFGNNQFYFAIAFEYDANLVEAVKSLPGRKWNNETKVWGVPSKYETEVLVFAKKYKFFLNFEGDYFTNNIHLVQFTRKQGKTEYPNVPNGISFCEGRLANKQHERLKKEFWWCGGQPCFSKCETIHQTDEWEKYTLLDFCEILGMNTDEVNKMGDFIPKGYYYLFIALINRFNRLLEKLYCKDCGHILYHSDFGTGHFAAHTVVRFKCRNDKCLNKDEIYLNHCLNGQCNSIVDSRVSKKCKNGLYICADCGSCCSHSMLERRLSNLKQTGGYIHPQLVKCVQEKLGHLERGEYFCHRCKSAMTEKSNDIFECSKCNVEYDTTKYKFKRPHMHLRNKKTMTGNNRNNEDSKNDDFDFQF